MAFKRVAQFDQIFIDSDNLSFGVYTADPSKVTNMAVKYHGHDCPDGYTYLDRNRTYRSYDLVNRADGLYEDTNGKMPHALGWPGSTGFFYVAELENGAQIAPWANEALVDAYASYGHDSLSLMGGSDNMEGALFGGLMIRNVKLKTDIWKRWNSELGGDDMVSLDPDGVSNMVSVDTYLEYMKTYRTHRHKITPGWTWNDDDENSSLRAHIMWAPYQEVEDRSLDEEFYRKPFDGFLRTFTAVPVAPPGRDYWGFYSEDSDFHYLCMYRLYGFSQKTGVPLSTRIHPINDYSIAAPHRGHMFVPEALLGKNPPKPYNVNIPSNHTFEAFRNYLQPAPADIVKAEDDTANKFYGGDPFINFQICYGFTYETYAQSFNTFGDVSKKFALHPSNPYCGQYRGEVESKDFDDVDHQQGKEYGTDALWEPARSDLPTHQLLAKQAKYDSRFFYIQKVDQFNESGALNEFKYDINFVRSGRLGSATAVFPNATQWMFDDADYEVHAGFNAAQWNSVKPIKVDRVSQEMMVHKLRYPRPMDGQVISVNCCWGRRNSVDQGSMEYYNSYDGNTHFDLHAEEDSAKYSSYTDDQQKLCDDARSAWENWSKFEMLWGPIAIDGREAVAYAKDYRKKMFYYGHEKLMYLLAWMRFENIVKNLNRIWVYDDTPKEARIRMQKNSGYDSSRLTSIVDSSLSAQFDSDYEEFLGKYIADDHRLKLGGTFTEKQVRDAEEKMGVPEGTYDSRIGTPTSIGGRN